MTQDVSGLSGFDLFRDETIGIIKALTDPGTKRGLLELYAEEVVKQTKNIIKSDAKQQSGTLARGIVYRISSDNNQVLVGWSRKAPFGPLLEQGYHHIASHKFIKIPHLRPGANQAKYELRVTARLYLQARIKDYNPYPGRQL